MCPPRSAGLLPAFRIMPCLARAGPSSRRRGLIQPSHDENHALFFYGEAKREPLLIRNGQRAFMLSHAHTPRRRTMMNKVKLLGAAAMLMTTLAIPALAQDRGGNGPGGGAMPGAGAAVSGGGGGAVGCGGAAGGANVSGGGGAGAGQGSFGGRAAAPSGGGTSNGGGMRANSGNIGAGGTVRGDSGRTFSGDRG